MMMPQNNNQIEFEWDDTGKMTIELDGNTSAGISFYPSDNVIEDTLNKAVKQPTSGFISKWINSLTK